MSHTDLIEKMAQAIIDTDGPAEEVAEAVLDVLLEDHQLVPRWVPEPHIVETKNGPWLAVSPPGYTYTIGVVGEIKEQARSKWFDSQKRWEELGRRAALGEDTDET